MSPSTTHTLIHVLHHTTTSVLTQTLAHAVGQKYVYSDLSMITMQYIVGTLAQAHGLVHTSDLLPACDSSNDGESTHSIPHALALNSTLHI